MSFDILPAIDLRGGRVVRLRQGDYAHETVFAEDPVELAQRYAAAGAHWLHVVDLDGARAGRLENLAVIEAIAGIARLKVQAGGGVRDNADLERLYVAGVARVVIGSLAVEKPDVAAGCFREFGAERLVLALDVRRERDAWVPAVHGWVDDSRARLDVLVEHYARVGVRHMLCTDISRDGTLGGFNLALYRELAALVPAFAVQASGGARSLDDIRAVRAAGARGVVLGRALLERRFTLEAALAC